MPACLLHVLLYYFVPCRWGVLNLAAGYSQSVIATDYQLMKAAGMLEGILTWRCVCPCALNGLCNMLYVCMRMCVCVCVCERERERERDLAVSKLRLPNRDIYNIYTNMMSFGFNNDTVEIEKVQTFFKTQVQHALTWG